MYRSKGAVRALAVLYSFLGIFCVFWTLFFSVFVYFCLFIEPSEEVYIAGFGVVCVFVGVCGAVVSAKEKRLLKRLKSMQVILSPVADTPVSVVAREWGVSLENAEKTVKKMIRRGHLRQVRIDALNHKVVPLHKPYHGETVYRRADIMQPQPAVKETVLVEVKCEQCGASNTVEKGKTGRCEYCDSVIDSK